LLSVKMHYYERFYLAFLVGTKKYSSKASGRPSSGARYSSRQAFGWH